MNWLAVDTAMNACGVAVRRADGAFTETLEMMERGQAERLMPMIVETIEKAGLALTDIDAYAVTTGPGTFTGLRVGLATIRALAQAAGKPAYGIGTFDAVAAARPETPLCIILETKRQDFYVRAPGHGDACMTADHLAGIVQPGWTLAGDAAARAAATLALSNPLVSVTATPLAQLIALAGAMPPPASAPEPVYLRGADVSIARRKPAQIV